MVLRVPVRDENTGEVFTNSIHNISRVFMDFDNKTCTVHLKIYKDLISFQNGVGAIFFGREGRKVQTVEFSQEDFDELFQKRASNNFMDQFLGKIETAIRAKANAPRNSETAPFTQDGIDYRNANILPI